MPSGGSPTPTETRHYFCKKCDARKPAGFRPEPRLTVGYLVTCSCGRLIKSKLGSGP